MKLTHLLESYNVGGWVTPTGNYTETGVHIADILQHPEKFGLTKEFIDSVYERHGEEKFINGMPNEGEAREEIILLVLKSGWIRFRRYKNYWSINVYELNSKTKENLKKWLRTMIKNGTMHQYDELRIGDVKTDSMKKIDADDLLKTPSNVIESTIMESYSQLVTVYEQPNIPLLTEVKLSRVYNHFKGEAPVAIITAFRAKVPLEKNVANNKTLANTLRTAGMGFVWVDGAWIENRGTEDEVHASEVSILVIGAEGSDEKMFSVLVNAATQYNQDSFIFKRSGVGSPVKLYDKHGNEELSFDRISMDRISDLYTRMRKGSHAGRSFFFEGEKEDLGFFGRLLEKHTNKFT